MRTWHPVMVGRAVLVAAMGALVFGCGAASAPAGGEPPPSGTAATAGSALPAPLVPVGQSGTSGDPAATATVAAAAPPSWPPAPRASDLKSEPIRAAWSRSIDQVPGPRALHARHGVVAALTWKGRIVALDAESGRKLWAAPPQATGVVGDEQMLAVSDRFVVLANEASNQIAARDLRTGKPIWQQPVRSRVTSLSACRGYRLAAVTYREELAGKISLVAHAVDPRNGTQLWQQAASGTIVGSGGGHLFVAEPSGVGRLSRKIVALSCADGRLATLPSTDTRFVSFYGASDDGTVLLYGFDFARTTQRLCVARAGRPERTCVDTTQHAPPGYRLGSATVRGRYLYFSMGHLYAHNLDPTPDSPVTVFDLVERRVVARTDPMVSNAPLVDAGSLLLTGIGGTGAKDFAHLLDPADGRVVRTLPLAQAATAFAADEHRAFVASRQGRVHAMELPLPGRARPPVRAVQARPTESSAPSRPVASFRIEQEFSIDAHPLRAATSGQATAGAVGAVAFLGPSGDLLATGGNDDRVRVFDLKAAGAQVWQSPALGKDVDGLSACRGTRFAGQIYGGAMSVFNRRTAQAHRFHRERVVRHEHAWMFGLSPDCQRLVSDSLKHDDYRIYDPAKGALLDTVASSSRFDRRGTRLRAGRLVHVDGSRQLVVVAIDGTTPGGHRDVARPAIAFMIDGAKLVQAWAVDEKTLLTEHCSPERCAIRIADMNGKVRKTTAFDIRGSVWTSTVPSAIDVSADGAYLFFYRDGLEMLVVRLKTGERQLIGSVPRTMSSTPDGVFSPFDPRRLAVAMSPKPHQVTLVRIREQR